MEAAVVLPTIKLLTRVALGALHYDWISPRSYLLVAGALALRDGEHLWLLVLMFGWYCFAMLAFLAAIWAHYKKSSRLPR
ncbi:hypothetical protein [Rhizobium laguerreae]|uniref:hypothetical protein n=1 Tax=Rhizobium laguerreae TaxID=1076926 RepID=UPI001FE674C5|nr:hypothetical protein [Rhizobium laguerreae]